MSFDSVVVARRDLVRSLLTELLRDRCSMRQTAGCAALEEALAPARAARFLVVDSAGFSPESVRAFTERLRQEFPELGVLVLDDSGDIRDVAGIVSTVRLLARPLAQLHESLTPLEYEVMLEVAAGLRNADIARRMRRSSKTVEKHRANALRKLGFRNVAQLTAYALRQRLIDFDTVLKRKLP